MCNYNLKDFEIEKDYILNVHNNSIYNKVILSYYTKLYEEVIKDTNLKKYNFCPSRFASLENCNKFWNVDVYMHNSIKDFVNTRLCHDKFCNNCKKVVQASRMSKYIPQIEPYKNNLYHLTLTQPNVEGHELKYMIKKMSSSFRQLIRYINGTKNLSFIDFSKYGYKGAIRSLEITFKGNDYHPHYHCAFVFENLILDKEFYNTYSIDYYNGREDRLFSDFEIIIQKLWYMILNDIEVNRYNYLSVGLGYSCNCDKFYEDDYAELFKYMTKETDEKDNILTYDNFKDLYFSTFKLKQIQGYGIFYRIINEDLKDAVNETYANIVDLLKEQENPISKLEKPYDLLNDNNFMIISRRKIFEYLRKL